MALHVRIIAPDHVAFDGDVRSVVLPAWDGEMEALPGHAKFAAVLKEGTLRLELETGEERRLQNTATGLAEITQHDVTIFVDELAS